MDLGVVSLFIVFGAGHLFYQAPGILLKSISPITGSCLRVPFVMNGKLNRKQRRVLYSPSIELRARTTTSYELAINVMIPYLQDCYGCRGVKMSGCVSCVSLSEW